MTADFHPHPAPPKKEDAEKTLNIRVDRKRKGLTLFIVVLAFVLVAGIIAAVALDKLDGGGKSAATSVAVADGPAAGSADVAKAAEDCPNPDGDEFVDWFCKQIQPAFKVNAADHARIDRLEAERQGGGTDTLLWVIVLGVGVLTVYNTIEARRTRGTKKG